MKISHFEKVLRFTKTNRLSNPWRGFPIFRNIRSFSSSTSTSTLLQVEASCQNDNVLLSIVPPNKMDGIQRTPTTVVCVIDVSGSMGGEAKILTGTGQVENFGFSTLDLVKHSIRTIIKSFTKDDKLSLVSFSTKSKVVFELTTMDENGRERANEALKN